MKSNKLFQRILLVAIGVVLAILLIGILITGNKKEKAMKVGLIITGSVDEQGWNSAHYRGVRYACEKLGTELLVKEHVPEDSDSCAKAVHSLVKEDASMIILSSYAYPSLMRDVIQSYPDVAFYGISAEYYADNMTSYFGRMYQARYLSGVLAGRMTQNNSIGYVAAMANNEVNRGINAFTLGVRCVNPDATVYVSWTNSWNDEFHHSSEFTGGHSRVEIPVPFPNTEVKRSNVDGTAACPWESRKLPVFFISKPP